MIKVKEIKKLMIDYDMKQKDLAELLNTTISNVSSKLSGKREFTIQDLKIMADRFKVDISIFF